MKTVIIIPARFASTRYPGKPLVELKLPDGAYRSLIQLSWEAPDVSLASMRFTWQQMTHAFARRHKGLARGHA